MGGTQALVAARTPAFTFEPNKLTIITDHADPLYDPRLNLPIRRAMLIDIAVRGIHTPISVRRRGKLNIVVAGKQRTKHAVVLNALVAGIKYEGILASVRDAIHEFGADADLVKQLAAFTGGKPLRIRAVAANSGEDLAARMLMRSENAQRVGDAKAERIRAIRDEVERFGTPVDELAAAEGVSEATVKRWLKSDPDAKPKKRGKATRPGLSAIKKLAASLNGEAPAFKLALRWVAGEATSADVINELPALAGRI